MTVLVDSDILIEVSRGRDEDIVSKWMDLSRSDAAVLYSPVSVAELWAGARPKEGGRERTLTGCRPSGNYPVFPATTPNSGRHAMIALRCRLAGQRAFPDAGE